MALSEFELIRRYFQQPGLMADPLLHPGVALGIGDDCALLDFGAATRLAISLDVLVAGVHFPAAADPPLIGERALAVALSDLAAMGATPLGFTLGLTLPAAEPSWLAGFSAGLAAAAQRYGCPLLGGDTTAGPLQVAVQVHGTLPFGKALRRDAARVGDEVWVSGQLGAAALALEVLAGRLCPEGEAAAALLSAYYRPVPQLALGSALLDLAHAAQDVSDGLLADLGHIARASGVGMELQLAAVPVSPAVLALATAARASELALGGGDDYQLVFTAPPAAHRSIAALGARLPVLLTCIGRVVTGAEVQVMDTSGRRVPVAVSGYQHFA